MSAAFSIIGSVALAAQRPSPSTNIGPTIGGGVIVCNPRGYRSENADFDPHLVAEVAR